MPGAPKGMICIPELKSIMRLKRITYLALAEQAGYNKSTVWHAVRGDAVKLDTALDLLHAVDQRFP